jgi:23S rRNA (cytidine2498-2'-O)-methyltransferase
MNLENSTAYLTTEGHKADFLKEVSLYGLEVVTEYDRLVVLKGSFNPKLVWHQNAWKAPQIEKIESIGKAAKFLKGLGRNWAHYPFQSVRRGELIAKALPYVSFGRLNFGDKKPSAPVGSFSLLDNDTIIYSQECTSVFKNGEVIFNEDKINPPSRAYLKLWEAFTLIDDEDILPKEGDLTLDVGSCPGGWTWVLANYGADVYSYDKAPLHESLFGHEKIKFFKQSAFALEPKEFDRPIKWFCSDIICYPPKLLNLVKKFYDSGIVENFICTIKFQGETDFETMNKYLEYIPGSKIYHLHNNKHEVTWIKTSSLI